MVGTRGVPARYGGFETAVEEIGARLSARGHDIVVYCRRDVTAQMPRHRGMQLVHLPAVRRKSVETLTHTAISALHALRLERFDATVLFNAANSPFIPALRARGRGVATHVDGLEWKRSKWGRFGRRYYRIAEGLAARWSDALICDAQAIADYYLDEFGVDGDVITYGAPIIDQPEVSRIGELGLERERFHLVVARFEPENHIHLAVDGYRASTAGCPLVVVGAAPYSDAYTRQISQSAEGDPRIRLIGAVWDQRLLDELYATCRSYIHGHSVGGTNPSLLRAMGAGCSVAAYDVTFNREVLGDDGRYWSTVGELAAVIDDIEARPSDSRERGRRGRARARDRYRWDSVADEYEDLCRRLMQKRRRRRSTPSYLEIVRR